MGIDNQEAPLWGPALRMRRFFIGATTARAAPRLGLADVAAGSIEKAAFVLLLPIVHGQPLSGRETHGRGHS